MITLNVTWLIECRLILSECSRELIASRACSFLLFHSRNTQLAIFNGHSRSRCSLAVPLRTLLPSLGGCVCWKNRRYTFKNHPRSRHDQLMFNGKLLLFQNISILSTSTGRQTSVAQCTMLSFKSFTPQNTNQKGANMSTGAYILTAITHLYSLQYPSHHV